MTSNENQQSLYMAIVALIALVIGFCLGIWTNLSHHDTLLSLVPWAEIVGKLWLCGLITLTIPLVGSYFYGVVSTMVNERLAGKLGLHALLFHLLIMLLGIAFTLSLSYTFTEYVIGDFTLLLKNVPTAESLKDPSLIFYADGYQTLVANLILPVLIALGLIALVMSHFFSVYNTAVLRFAERVSKQSMRMTKSVMLFIPVAACALAFSMASKSGYTLVGIMGGYVFALITLLIGFTLVLYILATAFGRVPIGNFVRTLFPAQLIAATTRSSLATMPTLIESAQRSAGIPSAVTGLVIPFSISVFRLNRSISSTFSYVFLTTLYSIPTDLTSTLVFLLMIVVLSFGNPGIPSGGKLATMPLFLAMGVPLEILILLKAIDVIPDIFKTVLNVTEVMTITSMVTRSNSLALKFT